jgi:hypothetical protein
MRIHTLVAVLLAFAVLAQPLRADPTADRPAKLKAVHKAGIALVVVGVASFIVAGSLFAHIGSEWHNSNPLSSSEIAASISLGVISLPFSTTGGALWVWSQRQLEPPTSSAFLLSAPKIRF